MNPARLAFDTSGNLWVADFGVNSVIAYSGTTATGASISHSNAQGIAFDASGDLWVSDGTNHTITEYKPPLNGASASATISSGITRNGVGGLAFDGAGILYAALSNTPGSILGYVAANAATPITGTPLSVGSNPSSIAITP